MSHRSARRDEPSPEFKALAGSVAYQLAKAFFIDEQVNIHVTGVTLGAYLQLFAERPSRYCQFAGAASLGVAEQGDRRTKSGALYR